MILINILAFGLFRDCQQISHLWQIFQTYIYRQSAPSLSPGDAFGISGGGDDARSARRRPRGTRGCGRTLESCMNQRGRGRNILRRPTHHGSEQLSPSEPIVSNLPTGTSLPREARAGTKPVGGAPSSAEVLPDLVNSKWNGTKSTARAQPGLRQLRVG